MSALLPYDSFDLQRTWDSMTTWLDAIFAETLTSHRRLDAIEDDLEALDRDLTEMDRYLPAELPPADLVAADRLGMRLRDSETVLRRKWTSEPVRNSALRALRGIHRRYLGPIPDGREHRVVFEISGSFYNRDFSGFVKAHRLEDHARWSSWNTPGGTRILNAVEGPVWVHDVYRHLFGDTLRGAALRERYVSKPDAGGTDRADWFKERPETHTLGDAVTRPVDDILETALRLWDPHTEGSSYRGLADAVRAAELL